MDSTIEISGGGGVGGDNLNNVKALTGEDTNTTREQNK